MEGEMYGLVIIFSAFMIQFLTFGSSICIGVYNMELLEYFPDNTVGVSLIASLNFGILLGSGPLVSFLMTKFSFRKIAIFGSTLVVLGLLGMRLLPYIPAMCICFGLMCGFGSCCAYIPSHVLCGMYYDKNRSLATGVATSGSGLGGAVMPVVAGLLIETFSWKGSLMILAGLCLHLFVFSVLLRMPKYANVVECDFENLEDFPHTQKMQLTKDSQLERNRELQSNDPKSSKSPYRDKTTKVDVQFKPLLSETEIFQAPANIPDDALGNNNQSRMKQIGGSDIDRPTLIPKPTDTVLNCAVTKEQLFNAESKKCVKTSKKNSKYSRHVYIFTNYGFNIYFLSNILWNIAAAVAASFIPEYLHSQGISSTEAAILFGILGFGNFLGGVLGGGIGNYSWSKRHVMYTITNLFLGVVLAAFPVMGHRDLYFLWMLVFGLAFGTILGLLIIVLTDLIGIESLSNGLGYLMLAHGIGAFIGPPLAGALKEATGNFGSSIVLSGVMCICAGFIMLLLPCERFLKRGVIWVLQ